VLAFSVEILVVKEIPHDIDAEHQAVQKSFVVEDLSLQIYHSLQLNKESQMTAK
jgi:hypothetical protein